MPLLYVSSSEVTLEHELAVDRAVEIVEKLEVKEEIGNPIDECMEMHVPGECREEITV